MAGAVTTNAARGGDASPTRLSLSARLALQLALLVGAVIMVSPFAVMLVVSLVPTQAFLARNFSPSQFSLANYFSTFEQVPFARYYLNSIIVTVSVTVLQIAIASLAAFAFARLRFRGRETTVPDVPGYANDSFPCDTDPELPDCQGLWLVRHAASTDRA